MNISKNCLDLVKKWEGCYLTAYKCPAGVWTIGYGTTSSDRSITGTNIKSGMKITKVTAEIWLEKSLNQKYAPKVAKYDKVYQWTQNEFDALVSFAYNVGSIDQLTANGTRSKSVVREKILLYNKANGKVLKGLVNRRKEEYDLFTKKDKSNAQLADEVIQGRWGNGEDRRINLTAAGYDYAAVQRIVNQRLKV